MLRKLRMGQIRGAIGIILFCAVVGIWMLCDTGLSCITALMGAKPLTAKAELADIVGKYVSWEVLYPVDEYMETTKTTKINGVSTGTKKDRSSWLVLDEERGICLSVEVPYKRYDEMADQAEVFYDAMEQDQEFLETGVKIAGTLEVLEGEELDYYKRVAKQMGLDPDTVVYHIGDGRIHGQSLSNVYGITAIGSVFFLFAVLVLIWTIKDSPQKQIRKYLEANPSVTMEALESDFAAAGRQGSVFIGRGWTFSAKLDPLILDNSQVIWVHTASQQSRYGLTYYVLWEMLDGSTRKVVLSSEKKCKALVDGYSGFSHIVTGSNPEYSYLLRSDREAFLDLKYRTLSK